jgi:hypothetical protein
MNMFQWTFRDIYILLNLLSNFIALVGSGDFILQCCYSEYGVDVV